MLAILYGLKYAQRRLLKSPGSTLIMVLSLALGIGASAAIFSVVNGVVLRPLPYHNPHEIVTLWWESSNQIGNLASLSPPHFRFLRQDSAVFQDLGLFKSEDVSLTGIGEPQVLRGAFVTSSVFDVLGVRAAHGRVFGDDEDKPGGERIALLSDGLWKRSFGEDRKILGKTIRLNGKNHLILGVMPEGFEFPAHDTEVWTPFNVEFGQQYNSRGARWSQTVARLKAGVNLRQASENVNAVMRQIYDANDPARDSEMRVIRLHDHLVGKVRPALLLLLGAVGFVLLVTCANGATFLLIRGEFRQSELATMKALGASNSRLFWYSFCESGLLTIAGGVPALVLCLWFEKIMVRLMPPGILRIDQIRIDETVVGFALVLILVVALLAGILPALKAASNPDIIRAIHDKGAGSLRPASRPSVRHALVAAELALVLMLLAGAGLMIRSVLHVLTLDLGFRGGNVLTMTFHQRIVNTVDRSDGARNETGSVNAPASPWTSDASIMKKKTPGNPQEKALDQSDRGAPSFESLIESISSVPGVTAVGSTSNLPFDGRGLTRIESEENSGVPMRAWVNRYFISPNYFEVMGISVLRGRPFDPTDAESATPAVIVDKTLAARFWPDMDPIGKRINVHDNWLTVVGVVPNVRNHGLARKRIGIFSGEEQIFHPMNMTGTAGGALVIATTMDPLMVAETIRGRVLQLDPYRPVRRMASLKSLVSEFTAEPRFYMLLLSIFASLSLVLGAMGIYVVARYSIVQQTHGIGIRMAIGARTSDILRLIVKDSLILILIGLGIGMAGAVALTRLLSGMIHGITPTDPATFASACLIFGAVSLTAACIPAYRAARIPPMAALRCE